MHKLSGYELVKLNFNELKGIQKKKTKNILQDVY